MIAPPTSVIPDEARSAKIRDRRLNSALPAVPDNGFAVSGMTAHLKIREGN
jgi:hypothetical protein